MAPSLLLGLLYRCRTPWWFAGRQLGGRTQGVDVMRKGSSAQGGLRASACWRLAQVVVSEALRPFTLGLQFSYMKRGGAGAGEGGQDYESHQLAKRDYCRIINPGPGMFMRLSEAAGTISFRKHLCSQGEDNPSLPQPFIYEACRVIK